MLFGKVANLTLHAIQHFYSQLKTFVQRIQNEAKLVTKTFPFASVHEVQEWYSLLSSVMNVYIEKSHIKLELYLHNAT
jgi:hypothetical protein